MRNWKLAKARVQEVAEKIAAGKFPAKPGYQCAFCPYRNLCPATEKVVYVSAKEAGRDQLKPGFAGGKCRSLAHSLRSGSG